MKIYVGNLPFTVDEHAVRGLFEEHGQVDSVKLITDRDTGRPRGFGFVEMNEDSEARAAIEALHEQEVQGRNLVVNEARPCEDRPRGGGGGGGYGGGGGGYGGGGNSRF